jgi:hypothetical protein
VTFCDVPGKAHFIVDAVARGNNGFVVNASGQILAGALERSPRSNESVHALWRGFQEAYDDLGHAYINVGGGGGGADGGEADELPVAVETYFWPALASRASKLRLVARAWGMTATAVSGSPREHNMLREDVPLLLDDLQLEVPLRGT